MENTIEEIELKQNEEQEEGILTENPYFTLQNHQINEDIKEIEVDKKAASEVPKWRIKQIQPSYIMEGTEDIEDVTMLKRHNKPENDEKRRKRWDVQRIRERAHVARLRARSHDEGSHEMQELNNTELKTLKHFKGSRWIRRERSSKRPNNHLIHQGNSFIVIFV